MKSDDINVISEEEEKDILMKSDDIKVISEEEEKDILIDSKSESSTIQTMTS